MEVAYQKSCRETESIFAAEEIRRKKLQHLLLEDERDQLYEELVGCSDQVKHLKVQTHELQTAIETTSSNLESSQAELRIKLRETETLKVGHASSNCSALSP